MIYDSLPAIGIGHRDPRRPHVTGGIGGGVGVWRLLMHVFSRENRTATETRENAERANG